MRVMVPVALVTFAAFAFGACASSSTQGYDSPDAAGGPDASSLLPTDDSGGVDVTLPPPTSPVEAGDSEAGDASDAAIAPLRDVDASWPGRPPAAPLIVRTPYLSTWSLASSPAGSWPAFWTAGSATKAITGIARVDGVPLVFFGAPTGLSTTPGLMSMVSETMTATKTEYVFGGNGVLLTVDFLSPVEPSDLKRQSEPLGYINASVASSDGAAHTVSLYFDISGEWAHGDSSQEINWTRETVPHTGGNLTVQTFTPATPQQLTEVNQYPSWGTAFLAADATSAVTAAIGQDTVVRSLAVTSGALDGSLDSSMPRAISDKWPVAGFSFALGQVTAATTPVTLILGHARTPAISYLGTPMLPLWLSYWSTWELMVADAFDDGPAAATRAAALDERIASDATSAGGSNYAALCALALRQAFGGTELVGTSTTPWMMLKEISSDGNVSTVDVIYPASPAFLYVNPLYLKLLLDPLLAYAETGGWPKTFAEHDLGNAYPVAGGHNDGNEEDMPVEESANMLLMMAGYVQHATPADASAYATQHYAIAKQWANYLVANTLDPVNQNQTDDFTGFIDHSVNLSLKGIIGIGAMSILATASGNTADAASYLAQAKTFIATWSTKAQATSGKHLLLVYDEGQDAGFSMPTQSTWSLKYNALYDRILGLNLIPAAVLAEEATWYASQAQGFGVELDPRNTYTKSDWELWTAASIDDTSVRATLIDGVYGYVTTSTARLPFGDLYYPGTGQWDGFQARPVQGGMFSLLARQGAPIVGP